MSQQLLCYEPTLPLLALTSTAVVALCSFNLHSQAQTPPPSVMLNSSSSMAQISKVSQLRDVTREDWAYQALQNLVERYNCIAGYPDSTYRGSRAMTRSEFAAGLNACLVQLEKLIQENITVLQEDLENLKRLQQEFASELSLFNTRIENLETRVSYLEDHQFSTTTKLAASTSFSAFSYFNTENTQAALQYNLYIGLPTSFTGKDLLSVGLASSNTTLPDLVSNNNGRDVGSTREALTIWTYGGDTGNKVFVFNIDYVFPIIDGEDKWYVTITPFNGFNTMRYLVPSGPLTWEGYDLNNGAVSSFGQRNPIYRLGGGAGFLTSYYTGPWRFSTAYLATQGSNPQEGAGLFNGDQIALAQIDVNVDEKFSLALTYFYNYFGPGRFAFNSQYQFAGPDSPGFIGTALANRFDNQGVFFDEDVPVASNTFGLQTFYQINPKLIVGGFISQVNARLIGKGDAQILSYAVELNFPDLVKEGNLGGLILGVEPMLTSLNAIGVSSDDFKQDTSFHIEAFYRHQINNNLSVTPGFVWITAPNQDASNPDIFLGLVRTSFTF